MYLGQLCLSKSVLLLLLLLLLNTANKQVWISGIGKYPLSGRYLFRISGTKGHSSFSRG